MARPSSRNSRFLDFSFQFFIASRGLSQFERVGAAYGADCEPLNVKQMTNQRSGVMRKIVVGPGRRVPSIKSGLW